MTDRSLPALSDALLHAQLTDTLVDAAAFDRPADLMQAEAVQDEIIAGIGEIGGWKLGATMERVLRKLGLSRIFFGAVPRGRTVHAQALAGPWEASAGVECEYAFLFGADLPAGRASVSTDEVAGAIASVHAAFEIPASRYACGIGGEGGLMLVADNGAAGWLVIGEGRPLAAVSDLVHAPVRLTADGRELATGTAEAIIGAPIAVVADFVRLAHGRGYGIRAGQYVATGSCTGKLPVPLGSEIVAEFAHLGSVRVRLDAI